MPVIIPGYDTQHQTVTVAANDTDINAAITTQAADGWLVVSIVVNGSDITILFTRNVALS